MLRVTKVNYGNNLAYGRNFVSLFSDCCMVMVDIDYWLDYDRRIYIYSMSSIYLMSLSALATAQS